MKRDMDIIRRIALQSIEMQPGYAFDALEGVDKATFSEHILLMMEAGLIDADIQKFASQGDPPKATVTRLTWAGQDFASSIASDTVWSKVKSKVIKPGTSWTFGILTELIKQELVASYLSA